MAKTSQSIRLFGAFFLLLGLFWISAIYMRGQALLPKEDKPYFQKHKPSKADYVALKQEMKQVLKRPLAVEKYSPKTFIMYCWMIVSIEFLCSLFYIISGLSLLRVYKTSRIVIFFTLIMDVYLKAAVYFYQIYLASPIQQALQKDVLQEYFMPTAHWLNKTSIYLTGVHLSKPIAPAYLAVYAAYIVFVFAFFTRSKVVEQIRK